MGYRRINIQYTALQGLFWMLFCVTGGFISFYLQGNGFGNSLIGIITAVFCLVAFILQPMAGNICDRVDKLTWKKLIIILGVPYIITCILLLIVKSKGLIVILFGTMYVITFIYLPLINSAVFAYEKEGVKINFGIARGTGSTMYALVALIIGSMARKSGIKIIPLSGLIIIVLFLGITSTMPVANKIKPEKKEVKHMNVLSFIRNYPYFSIMLLAVLFMFFSHNIIGTYLLQIIQSLGGNSANLGRAMFIQAVVEIPVLFTFSFIMGKIKVGNLMVLAGIGYFIRAILYFVSADIGMIYITQFSQIFSFAIIAAASVYFTGMVVNEQDQTTGQAFMSGMMSAGTVLGSFFGGAMLDCYGVRTLLTVNIFITLVGLIIAIYSIVMIRGRKISEGV
jgi:MFS transporter